MTKRLSIGVACVLGLAAVLHWNLLSRLSSANYLPHRYCYMAKPGLIWTNAVSDSVIAVSYFALFICLFYVTGKLRNNDSFRGYLWILVGFALFIAACGLTHVMETVTVWWPLYPLSTALKVVCAAVSVPTAIFFSRATPTLAGDIEHLLVSLKIARRESENEAASYREQIEAINRSHMMLELGMDGRILSANANYLAAFGYTDFELVGQHHNIFMSEQDQPSPRHQEFWKQLRAGKYQAGVFCQSDKKGRELWIEASYNPVLDRHGVPVKVVQFASNVTDRVKIQNDLRDAEARLKAILDNVVDGILTIDGAGTIASVNTAAIKIFGYPSEELVGQNIKLLMPEPDRGAHDGYLANYEPGASTRAIGVGRELEAVDRNGHLFPIELTVTDFSFQGRRMFVGLIRDITERKQQERTLRRTQQVLDRTGRITHVGGWEIDLCNNNEVFWSTEMYNLVGIPEDRRPTFEGGLDLYTPETRPVIVAAIEKAIADRTGFAVELPLIRPDGRKIWTRITSTVECEEGKAVRLVGAFQDVTDRVLEQKALQDANSRVKLATENGGIGIWDWEITKNVLACDPVLFRLYGVPDAEQQQAAGELNSEEFLRPKDYASVRRLLNARIHPEDRRATEDALRESLDNNAPYKVSFRVMWDDQSVHYLRAAGNVSRDGAGRPVRMVGLNWDVTELMQANEKYRQAMEMARESNRAKSDFLANMSHEIRTPMNAILGMTYLAQRTGPDAKLLDYLNKIGNAAQSLLGIVNDILDFSKIEAGKLELEVINFSLEEVLRNLVDVVGQRALDKGIELVTSVADDVPPFLVGDPLRVGQILINLVNNAVKFTDVGKITIRVSAEDKRASDLLLRISVSDSGIGMAPEQVATLFQPFHQGDTSFTRKYGGTGLGLAICKQLSGLMGGEITAKSELGKGSTFYFTARFGVARHIEARFAASKSAALENKSVLVVDDSEATRHVLLTMLEQNGFRARAVASGEEALSVLARASQAGEPIDLVVIDWRLPGIDGVETSKRIKANPSFSQMPELLMVSGFEREEIFAGGENTNFDGFLSKPVKEEQLMRAIATAFGSNFEADAKSSSDRSGEVALELTGRHVLLVEDNDVNRFLAAELLSDLGIVVTNAVNGREGVDRVMAEPFDLVLMDIQMPVMDGLAATQLIRQDSRFANLPVIAMTAHAMSGDRERSLSAGMNDHLTKPINPDLLAETLKRWMPTRAVQPIGETRPVTPESAKHGLPEQLPPFDLPAALARANGKPELLRKMLLSFRNQFKSAGPELRRAIEEGRMEEASRLAHSLKGVAATLEAKDLAEAAGSVERAIREEVLQGLESLVSTMEQHLEPAIAAAGTLDRRTAPEAPAAEPRSGPTQMTILLVDDQSGYLDLLKDVFGTHTEVLYASDGHAALGMAIARVPDLILLDVMMAGMDGYEVFDRLHANAATRDIPVIFLTGLGSVAEETKGLNMGAADYVTKPINPVVVRTRVTHQVELRRTQQELMRKTAEEHAAELAQEEARAAEITRLGHQALALRDEFLSHVSHELRSPLNSIYSFSSIIADGLAGMTTREQDEYLLIIQKNVRQLQAMIEDLLAITASKNGKLAVVLQETTLSDAILDAVHTCEANAQEKRIQLSCSISPGLPSVYADPVRVLQVLTILCDNAIKFTPEGGTVRMQAKTFDKVPGYLLIEVSDSGCGIKPEHLERIFEHLYQVTDTGRNGRRGLGLGLHIAKELMMRQGGSIWASSAQGAGSVFSLTLPVFAGQTSDLPVMV